MSEETSVSTEVQPTAAGISLRTSDDLLAMLGPSHGKYTDEQALAEASANTGGFLPYISAMGGFSSEVQSGAQPIGTILLSNGKEGVNLGKSFLCILLEWRQKAMVFKPAPKSYFNPKSQQFAEIAAAAEFSDSGKGFGPEVLVYLPDMQIFATIFFSSKSGRIEAPNALSALLRRALNAKFTCEMLHSKKNDKKWHSLTYHQHDGELAMPDPVQLKAVLDSFRNPPEDVSPVTEKAEENSRG